MSTHTVDPTVVIRAARGSDGPALEDLARMDSQRPLHGDDILLAEQDGKIVAAITGARTIADPFRPTGELVALLQLHAGRATRVDGSRSRMRVPRLRAA